MTRQLRPKNLADLLYIHSLLYAMPTVTRCGRFSKPPGTRDDAMIPLVDRQEDPGATHVSGGPGMMAAGHLDAAIPQAEETEAFDTLFPGLSTATEAFDALFPGLSTAGDNVDQPNASTGG